MKRFVEIDPVFHFRFYVYGYAQRCEDVDIKLLIKSIVVRKRGVIKLEKKLILSIYVFGQELKVSLT